MSNRALKMRCPHCDIMSNHITYTTNPLHYCWSDNLTEILKEYSYKNVLFRKRTKYCKMCRKLFETIEISHFDFSKITNTLEKTVAKNQKLIEENQDLIEKYQNLTDKIHKLEM